MSGCGTKYHGGGTMNRGKAARLVRTCVGGGEGAWRWRRGHTQGIGLGVGRRIGGAYVGIGEAAELVYGSDRVSNWGRMETGRLDLGSWRNRGGEIGGIHVEEEGSRRRKIGEA